MAGKRSPSKKTLSKKNRKFFGIAEWYGQLYRSMSLEGAQRLAVVPSKHELCPYFGQVPALAPRKGENLNCNKAGGVCSIRNFRTGEDGGIDFSRSPISATCPNRFLERGEILRHIGSKILQTDNPKFAKEIPFLKRHGELHVDEESVPDVEPVDDLTGNDIDAADDLTDPTDPKREDVGKIDLVLVNPDKRDEWCAVEIQAVYFSGAKMSSDLKLIRAHTGNDLPGPAAGRRPDFRSSGPKRLMPQLMIKVPTLRRWGKKMVVVVDQPFFGSMACMERVDHISNSDIVWLVVKFDDGGPGSTAELKVVEMVLTTLEESIKGLTAGRPTSLQEFQDKISTKAAPSFPV